jgi:hypothetical protein
MALRRHCRSPRSVYSCAWAIAGELTDISSNPENAPSFQPETRGPVEAETKLSSMRRRLSLREPTRVSGGPSGALQSRGSSLHRGRANARCAGVPQARATGGRKGNCL